MGTPNTSTTSCASVVAMPCPIWLTAENTSITPSAFTSTVTRSSSTLPPVHSRKVAMPRPRSLPAACSARARLEAAPVGERQPLVHDLLELAHVVHLPHRVLVRHLLGRMKLRRRSSMRSMPVWRAASSISRSMMKIASGRPAPR
jgi:hypothetical protein